MSQNAPVLIIGGNGKTGRRVDARLRARAVATRAVSRSTAPSFDWAEPKTWADALDGASAAYVTFQPDLAVPGAGDAIAELGRLAREKGLKRVVLLSGRGEDGARRAEEALKASGVAWTVVRASWFDQNFSENFLLDGVLAGEIALPAGGVREPFIDADDIADVAVAALSEDGHANRLYEVTGPQTLTFAEAVDAIARELDRPIRYVEVTPDAFVAGLRADDVPAELINLLHTLFTTVLDGRNAKVMHGVDEALGRPPRDFSTYVRKTAATGVWDISQ